MAIPSPAMGLLTILRGINGFINPTVWLFAVGQMTPDPDRQMILRNTGGRAGEVALAIDYPSVQILCRGTKAGYDEAYQKLRDTRDALVAIPTPVAAYTNLTSCITIGDILELGYDDAERPQFALNLQLIVSYDAVGYRT